MYFPDEVLSGAKSASDDKIVEGCSQSTCYLKRIKNTTQIDTGMTRCCCAFGICLCVLVNQTIIILGLGVSRECGNDRPGTRLLFFY